MEINRLLSEQELIDIDFTMLEMLLSVKRIGQFACDNQFVLQEVRNIQYGINDLRKIIGGSENLLEELCGDRHVPHIRNE